MKIYASMIVYNEQEYIGRCLKSLMGLVDGVVIVDGGSTDDTLGIIEDVRNDHKKVEFIVDQCLWQNDFAQQRQNSFGSVPDDTDWFFRVDADETLSTSLCLNLRPILEKAGSEVNAVRIRQVNLTSIVGGNYYYAANIGGWETWPRIWRYSSLLRWVGQVHERLCRMTRDGLKDIPENEVLNLSAAVLHYGWISGRRRIERENLYMGIPGSGVVRRGDLIDRHYEVRLLPGHSL